MPAALYASPLKPRKGKPTVFLSTPTRVVPSPRQVKARLLCRECEQRFNRNGESEVLRWVAPKLGKRTFPLLKRLRASEPEHTWAEMAQYSSSKCGIDARKFGYFALSLAWRASVHTWPFEGEDTAPCDIGEHEEPIRRFLMDEAPFPSETAVIVIVCRDEASREHWIAPGYGRDGSAWKFWLLTRGVHFIIWFGPDLAPAIRASCCYSAPGNPILLADCEKHTRRALGKLSTI